MNAVSVNRNKTTRRQVYAPGRQPLVRAKMNVVVAAALVSMFGAAAGTAYAKFDIPTGANPSPLFGATPFSQQILLFEEFGPQPLPDPTTVSPHSLPDPNAGSGSAS